MTRDDIRDAALISLNNYKCIIAELATGSGKSKIAIDCINKICDKVYHCDEEEASILLVVAKSVHKKNWLDEIEKWGGIKTDKIVIECYESLKKHEGEYWDVVVLDECHHIQSEARKEILKSIHINYHLIGLSATISNMLKHWFYTQYNTKIIRVNLQQAIDNDILPEPRIYLFPLNLDNTIVSECILSNVTNGVGLSSLPSVHYNNRWTYKKNRVPCKILCTPKQYIGDLDNQIEWYKQKYMRTRSEFVKNTWLRLCNNRLKWLSNKKTPVVENILKELRNQRTITFCNSIEQTELLGKNCIHSKNKLAQEYLNKFNDKKIKHITSCQMLNEGVNIVDCRIGIFANINSSEIISKQRVGRILRHKSPIIIIPFYKETREEEIVKGMMEEYNPSLITFINSIDEILL